MYADRINTPLPVPVDAPNLNRVSPDGKSFEGVLHEIERDPKQNLVSPGIEASDYRRKWAEATEGIKQAMEAGDEERVDQWNKRFNEATLAYREHESGAKTGVARSTQPAAPVADEFSNIRMGRLARDVNGHARAAANSVPPAVTKPETTAKGPVPQSKTEGMTAKAHSSDCDTKVNGENSLHCIPIPGQGVKEAVAPQTPNPKTERPNNNEEALQNSFPQTDKGSGVPHLNQNKQNSNNLRSMPQVFSPGGLMPVTDQFFGTRGSDQINLLPSSTYAPASSGADSTNSNNLHGNLPTFFSVPNSNGSGVSNPTSSGFNGGTSPSSTGGNAQVNGNSQQLGSSTPSAIPAQFLPIPGLNTPLNTPGMMGPQSSGSKEITVPELTPSGIPVVPNQNPVKSPVQPLGPPGIPQRLEAGRAPLHHSADVTPPTGPGGAGNNGNGPEVAPSRDRQNDSPPKLLKPQSFQEIRFGPNMSWLVDTSQAALKPDATPVMPWSPFFPTSDVSLQPPKPAQSVPVSYAEMVVNKPIIDNYVSANTQKPTVTASQAAAILGGVPAQAALQQAAANNAAAFNALAQAATNARNAASTAANAAASVNLINNAVAGAAAAQAAIQAAASGQAAAVNAANTATAQAAAQAAAGGISAANAANTPVAPPKVVAEVPPPKVVTSDPPKVIAAPPKVVPEVPPPKVVTEVRPPAPSAPPPPVKLTTVRVK